MDLDDDELKATRTLNGVHKKKTANEMFYELGYIEKFKNHCEDEMYRKDSSHQAGKSIKFYNYSESIEIYPCKINMQELQAINKKCEELGWI